MPDPIDPSRRQQLVRSSQNYPVQESSKPSQSTASNPFTKPMSSQVGKLAEGAFKLEDRQTSFTKNTRVATFSKFINAIKAGQTDEANKHFSHFIETQSNRKNKEIDPNKLDRYIAATSQANPNNIDGGVANLAHIHREIKEAVDTGIIVLPITLPMAEFQQNINHQRDALLKKGIDTALRSNKTGTNEGEARYYLIQLIAIQTEQSKQSGVFEMDKILSWAQSFKEAGLRYSEEGNRAAKEQTLAALNDIKTMLANNQPELLSEFQAIDEATNAILGRGLDNDLLKLHTELLPQQQLRLEQGSPLNIDQIMERAGALAIRGKELVRHNMSSLAQEAISGIKLIRDELGLNRLSNAHISQLSAQEKNSLYGLNSLIDDLNFHRMQRSLQNNDSSEALNILNDELIAGQIEHRVGRQTIDVDKILNWAQMLSNAGKHFIQGNQINAAERALIGLKTIREKIGFNDPDSHLLNLLPSEEIDQLKSINTLIQILEASL